MDGEEGSEGWGEDEDGGAGCPTSDEAVTERMGTDMVVMKDAISFPGFFPSNTSQGCFAGGLSQDR